MEWVSQWPDEYQVDAISVRGDEWKQHDFSEYDSVLHVAGIAHIKETKKNRELYYKVNRDLAFEVAKKSKEAGIPHFVFLSSMSIYGLETGVINKDIVPMPKSAYGKSKYEAENLIKGLEDEQFKVAIVRPPMIYGPNCPGNYGRLAKFARITPVFPKINNKRSMIFIDNLAHYIKCLINNNLGGFHCPQNLDYINTFDLVKTIRLVHSKKTLSISLIKPLINILKIKPTRKILGDLNYTKSLQNIDFYNDFYMESFEKTISLTERVKINNEA